MSVYFYLRHDDFIVAIIDLAIWLFLAEEAIQRMEKEWDDAQEVHTKTIDELARKRSLQKTHVCDCVSPVIKCVFHSGL